ncbi:MAG: xanthine dehydrogenase family protein subunit M [Pseudomonadota bacterium]
MNPAYEKAKSVAEAIALFSMNSGRHPILAGGTDIVVQWKSGLISPEGFVDISALDELKAIAEVGDSIEIGALASHSMIGSSKVVRRFAPALADACGTIGAVQIQNRGTIGGNIMNASPAGDTLPVLAALDAEILAQGLTAERWIGIRDFFTAYRKTALAPDEVLTRVRIPKMGKDEISRFYKIGTRRAQAISKVVMCVRGEILHGGIVRIAIGIGSVAPTVIRAPGTEALLKGQVITSATMDKARRSIEDEVHPIDDLRSTASYRRHICGVLLVRFLREALKRKPEKI